VKAYHHINRAKSCVFVKPIGRRSKEKSKDKSISIDKKLHRSWKAQKDPLVSLVRSQKIGRYFFGHHSLQSSDPKTNENKNEKEKIQRKSVENLTKRGLKLPSPRIFDQTL